MLEFPTFREQPALLDRWDEHAIPGPEWSGCTTIRSARLTGRGSGRESPGYARNSNKYLGTIAQWTDWTNLEFMDSGDYLAPGMMNPFQVDLESDKGTYIEPNVWMIHEV